MKSRLASLQIDKRYPQHCLTRAWLSYPKLNIIVRNQQEIIRGLREHLDVLESKQQSYSKINKGVQTSSMDRENCRCGVPSDLCVCGYEDLSVLASSQFNSSAQAQRTRIIDKDTRFKNLIFFAKESIVFPNRRGPCGGEFKFKVRFIKFHEEQLWLQRLPQVTSVANK